MAGQQALVQELQEQVAAQQVLIQELQDRLAKDSHNSGKPPSSDGLNKGRQKSLRRAGQQPRGGQRGHKGRTLMQVAEPDHVILHRLEECPHCQTKLAAEAAERACETADIRHTASPHRSDRASGGGKAMPWLWRVREGSVSDPPDPTHPVWPASEGACLLPVRPTVHPPGTHHRVADCASTVIPPRSRSCSQPPVNLSPAPTQLGNASANNSSLLLSSISMRVGCVSTGRLQWLHVASTEKLTHYHVDDKRGHVGMRAGGILPRFTGVALHDHWASYLKFSGCQHAFCNVHHLRDLLFVHEQYRPDMGRKDGLLAMRTIKAEVASTAELHTALPPERLACLRGRVRCNHSRRLCRQPTRRQRPVPDPSADPNSRRPKTCSTAYTNIKLASWPLCMISASPLTTIWSNAMYV